MSKLLENEIFIEDGPEKFSNSLNKTRTASYAYGLVCFLRTPLLPELRLVRVFHEEQRAALDRDVGWGDATRRGLHGLAPGAAESTPMLLRDASMMIVVTHPDSPSEINWLSQDSSSELSVEIPTFFKADIP